MQRAIEKRGIPTVSLSVSLDVTQRIKPPRAMFLPFMMGHHFGVPFHTELQKKIILEALGRIDKAPASGDIHMFPMTWAKARQEGKEIEAKILAKADDGKS
ncbi:MAG: hypothetical protein WKF92_10230 [Pyrinomonadaceae bacterium]